VRLHVARCPRRLTTSLSVARDWPVCPPPLFQPLHPPLSPSRCPRPAASLAPGDMHNKRGGVLSLACSSLHWRLRMVCTLKAHAFVGASDPPKADPLRCCNCLSLTWPYPRCSPSELMPFPPPRSGAFQLCPERRLPVVHDNGASDRAVGDARGEDSTCNRKEEPHQTSVQPTAGSHLAKPHC